jgi:hypothetical protein
MPIKQHIIKTEGWAEKPQVAGEMNQAASKRMDWMRMNLNGMAAAQAKAPWHELATFVRTADGIVWLKARLRT